MKLTRHSKERIEERVGLSKEASEKMAQKALQFGITHGETVGQFNKFLTRLCMKNRAINNIRVYNRYVFLFAKETLITVLNLPHDFHGAEDKLKKRKKQQQNEKKLEAGAESATDAK
jgi:hypothetical protein